MTTIGSPAGPLGRLEGLARGGGEGEGRCRLSCPPPKGATPCDRPPRGGPPNTTSSGHRYLHSDFRRNSLGGRVSPQWYRPASVSVVPVDPRPFPSPIPCCPGPADKTPPGAFRRPTQQIGPK